MEDKKEYVGKIVFFSNKKGYGFAAWEKNGLKQKDMFVHYSDIVMPGYKTLEKDQLVSFQIGENKRGEPKAILVSPLPNSSAPKENLN